MKRLCIEYITHFLISGTNLKNNTNIATIPATSAKPKLAGLGANGANIIEPINGAIAIILLPYGTPILPPHVTQVAGTAGPNWARRENDMPDLLQCGQVYMESLSDG